MKNISRSLVVIVGVAALAIGGTIAYFSHTETSMGNTFATGTINFNVDGGSWGENGVIHIQDMKPGYTDYKKFTINNTGSNPANVWKKLSDMVTTKQTGTPTDLSNQIVYDLSVKVYRQIDTQPYWWDTIYTDSDNKTLADIYGNLSSEDKGVLLGMIPAGGKMEVTQSYHMKELAGNDYQGEVMTFNMSLFGEQLKNTVTMVQKNNPDPSDIMQETAGTIYATLKYNARDDQFKYDLDVKGLSASQNYVVVSGANPWNGSDTVQLAAFTTDASGNYSAPGVVIDIDQDLTNAKIWVILASDWDNGTKHMTHWNPGYYLFETALIDYTDPIK